jgi:hypothetical protein
VLTGVVVEFTVVVDGVAVGEEGGAFVGSSTSVIVAVVVSADVDDETSGDVGEVVFVVTSDVIAPPGADVSVAP